MSEQPNTEHQLPEEKEQPKRNPNVRNPILGKGEDGDMLTLPLFLGQPGEEHVKLYQTATAYTAYRRMLSEELQGNGDVAANRNLAALKLAYENMVQENFPDMEEEVLVPMLINYIRFLYYYSDRLLLRDVNQDIILKEMENTIAGKDGLRITALTAVKPRDDKTLSVRDRMRRNFRRAQGTADAFTIVLQNSLIVLQVYIPEPTDLVRLMNTIATRLNAYGEKWNLTSIHLERAGISQLIVDFVLDRLKYHSVKDVADHYELKRYILANDINTIVGALLATTAPKGVSYRMYCTAGKCKHAENMIIDPQTMILNIPETMPEERQKVLYEITNEARKLSREELAKYAPVYKGEDGKELDTRIELSPGCYIRIGIPNLNDFFSTYNRIAERINPELRELAIDFPNPNEFKQKRAEWLGAIRGTEYLQWFVQTETHPAFGEEGEIEIITRSEDPVSFEQGLTDIFGDSEEVYVEALRKVVETIPRMTYTFFGIRNDVCPGCGETSKAPDVSSLKGFTPIDPITNFFDRTRMMIGTRTEDAITIEDSLS